MGAAFLLASLSTSSLASKRSATSKSQRRGRVHAVDYQTIYDRENSDAAVASTSSSSSNINSDDGDDVNLLAERLEHLSAGSPDYLGLNWLIDAMAVLISTHSATSSPVRSSSTHDAVDDDVDVALLDVCHSIKETTANILHYLASVEHELEHCSSSFMQITARNSGFSSAMLLRARCRLSRLLGSGNTLMQQRSTLLTSSISLLIKRCAKSSLQLSARGRTTLLVFVTAILGIAGTCRSGSRRSTDRAPNSPAVQAAKKLLTRCGVVSPTNNQPSLLWLAPLRQLQQEITSQSFTDRASFKFASGSLSHQLDTLQTSLDALNHILDITHLHHQGQYPRVDLSSAIDNLGKCCSDLRLSMAILHQHATNLSKKLINARMSLLDATCHP